MAIQSDEGQYGMISAMQYSTQKCSTVQGTVSFAAVFAPFSARTTFELEHAANWVFTTLHAVHYSSVLHSRLVQGSDIGLQLQFAHQTVLAQKRKMWNSGTILSAI